MKTDHTPQLPEIYDEIIADNPGGKLILEQQRLLNLYDDTFTLMLAELGAAIVTFSRGLRLRLARLQALTRPKDADV